MNKKQKCELAIEKGFKYNAETGEITNRFGKVIISKDGNGYVRIQLILNKKRYVLYSHHLAWYVTHKEVVDCLDHINGITYDNRISNLRSINNQQNHFNETKAKGYYWNKRDNIWQSQIKLNGKTIGLGSYKTEDEARLAYLNGKTIYHLIE